MGRYHRPRPGQNIPKHKQINPIWRGIGCLILVVFLIGGYFLAGELLELNQQQDFIPIPARFDIRIHRALPPLPGHVLLQAGMALFLDILVYAVMVTVWAFLNPQRDELEDLLPPHWRSPTGRNR
jgi:hypothetical protein